MQLSPKMSLAIDALIAAPSTIASYLRFDVDTVTSSMEVEPGEGWHSTLLEQSTHAELDEGAEYNVHFNELSLQEKCVLLSLMAEILDHFPDMSNFLSRLSIEPMDPSESESEGEGGGGGDDLFAFFLPVVRQVLAKDLGPAGLLGDCEFLPFPLSPGEALVEVLDRLRCMPVLVSYVESWLQFNDFAELIADPYFSTADSSLTPEGMDTDTDKENCRAIPCPPNYSLVQELSRPEDSWDSLLSVCWCMSVICADPEGEAPPFYRWHEAAVSAEAVSSHMLVSLLLYGGTLLFDAVEELATATDKTVAESSSQAPIKKLTEQFTNKILLCVNILVSKVLMKYSSRQALGVSTPTTPEEDCHEMSCQLFMALARFGDSLTAISHALPEVIGSENWHACSAMAVNVFSSSQYCWVDTFPELVEAEMVCLRSLMRCLSAMAAACSDRCGSGAGSSLRLATDAAHVDNDCTDILSQLSALLSGRIAATVSELPVTVRRKRPIAPPPPRARGKKKGTVASLQLPKNPAMSCSSPSTTSMRGLTADTSGSHKGVVSPAFGPDKGWVGFGLSDTMTFTEGEYTDICSRVRSLDSLTPEHESGFEVDEAGVLAVVVHAVGLWAAVLRDLVNLIDGAGCAFRRASLSVSEPSSRPQTPPNTSSTRPTIFSRMRSKRNNALPRSSHVSDNGNRSSNSCGGRAGRDIEDRRRALVPLHKAVSVLWETFLGDPITSFESDGAESAGLRASLSQGTATSTPSPAFREVAYISVRL